LHASAEAQDDRYYNKTLEQIDNLSLVRDRGGRREAGSGDDMSADEDGEEEGEEGVEDEDDPQRKNNLGGKAGRSTGNKKRKASRSNDGDDDDDNDAERHARNDTHEPIKTDKQKQMEDDWGLCRSHSPTGSQSTKGDDGEGEETDTEDEDDGPSRPHPFFEAADDDGDEEYDYDAEAASGSKGQDEEGGETQSVKEEEMDEEADKRLLPLRERDSEGTGPATTMGDAEDEDAYEEEAIFAHLVFYIDAAENAEKNGLAGSNPDEEVSERYVCHLASIIHHLNSAFSWDGR
jgi:DNA ligase-4